jgi:hypothetical protein
MSRASAPAFGLIFVIAAFAANHVARAADPLFCNQYANQADKSAKLAKQFKCGFQGPRWGKGTSGHLAWCLIVDQGLAQSEADIRATELKPCICHWYADNTMVQIATNIANKCGFTGLRWIDNKQAHYDWCFNQNPGLDAMKSEMKIREGMLNGC